MTGEQPRFVGGSQDYLRRVQYRDGNRLAARANLHIKYRTAPQPFFDWVGERFDLFDGARVLEVGCGTGWLWEESNFEIPPRVVLTLTDLSPGMVAEALGRVESSGRVDSVTGETADVQRLPFRNQTFDRVVANHMLYHVPKLVAAVAEIARVLAADGQLIASTNGRWHLRELWELRAAVFDTPLLDESAAAFGPGNGLSALREHFSDVRWLEYRDELIVTDPADVLAHICSAPPAESATQEQLARLEGEIDKAFARGGGQLRVSKDVGCFVARGAR